MWHYNKMPEIGCENQPVSYISQTLKRFTTNFFSLLTCKGFLIVTFSLRAWGQVGRKEWKSENGEGRTTCWVRGERRKGRMRWALLGRNLSPPPNAHSGPSSHSLESHEIITTSIVK